MTSRIERMIGRFALLLGELALREIAGRDGPEPAEPAGYAGERSGKPLPEQARAASQRQSDRLPIVCRSAPNRRSKPAHP
jgi:hypothetical protein